MIRRAATYVFAASLVVATTPAFPCTGISLKAQDGAAIRGRTLEFGFPLKSNVLVVPAGNEFSATLPDGGKGIGYKAKYGFVGMNGLGSTYLIADGLNEQGLSIGLFYFPGDAKYAEPTAEMADKSLAPQDFGAWVLGNFSTVDQVKDAVKDIAMVDTPMPGFGSAEGQWLPVHFFVQDKTGKSIAVEPIDGKLKVTEAPLGVMTNSPSYDRQMTNLSNYVNLTAKDVGTQELGPMTVKQTGSGSGMLGLPGDFTPPSRFVRAAIFSQNATPTKTAQETVFSAFHILNQFDLPKGSIIYGSPKLPPEITEWTSVNDLENLRYYVRTRQDQGLRMVDLKGALERAMGKISIINVQASEQKVEDISGNGKPAPAD